MIGVPVGLVVATGTDEAVAVTVSGEACGAQAVSIEILPMVINVSILANTRPKRTKEAVPKLGLLLRDRIPPLVPRLSNRLLNSYCTINPRHRDNDHAPQAGYLLIIRTNCAATDYDTLLYLSTGKIMQPHRPSELIDRTRQKICLCRLSSTEKTYLLTDG